MKISISTRLLVLAGVLSFVMLSGCGTSNNSKNSAPSSENVYYASSFLFDNHSTLWGSGYNAYGNLGLGALANTQKFQPVDMPVHPILGYAAGANHAIAFTNNSTILTWGSNLEGRLGLGVTVPSTGTSAFRSVPTPQSTPMKNSVHKVAAGWMHSLALVGTNVYAWGGNSLGQLGLKDFTNRLLPEPVNSGAPGVALGDIKDIAAGGSHSLALQEVTDANGVTTQTVWGWGLNTYGQIGQKDTSVAYPLPQPIQGIIGNDSSPFPPAGLTIAHIYAAGSYSLALMTDGSIWGWGYGAFGQLAQNFTTVTPNVRPRQLNYKLQNGQTTDIPITGVVKLALGQLHVLALKRDLSNPADKGQVLAWGDNEKAQLGIGYTTFYEPGAITADEVNAIIAKSQSGVTDIFAVGNTSFARIDNIWYGWGDNGLGQLGRVVPTNAIAYFASPIPIFGPLYNPQ